jgi:RimJ/RimL family protein N-acetyltransferase
VNDVAAPPPPPPLPPGYPADLERTWLAADGTAVRIRPQRPDDLDRELRFIESLSEQTLYLRLQYSARNVSRQEVARLLDLDYRDRMAFAALTGPSHDETIIGVSRYARIDATDRAECAIVVTDGWQGRGVGTELMRSLGLAARRNGIRTLVGTSLAENQRIQAWARRFGFDARTEPHSGGEVLITLDLGSLPS